MNSSSPRYGLVVVSVAVLALAAGVWSNRAQRAASMQEQKVERRETQHAVALLIRGFLADNQLKYSALSHTNANFAGRKMHSQARLTRTPQAMSIRYLKGDREGLETGYNGRWFWRHAPGGHMEAYAEVPQEAPTMIARHLSQMLENYHIDLVGASTVAGRAVEILEIRPINPIDGATGPGKRVSVDRETGLTVATQTFDYQWQQVMDSQLTEINFSPTITATTFASPAAMSQAAKKKIWLAQDMGTNKTDVAKHTGLQPPTPTYLPPGFSFDGVGVHRCNESGKGPMASYTRYRDGLNTLTVFAMPETKLETANLAPEQVCDFGPGTLVSRQLKAGFVIAVSDLPPQTLRRVVDSTNITKR